jgi:hypothetical protein
MAVSDCRYPNEAAAIRARGGLVLRVERPGVEPINAHRSEVALDGFDFDAVIDNDGSIEDLVAKLDTVLRSSDLAKAVPAEAPTAEAVA